LVACPEFFRVANEEWEFNSPRDNFVFCWAKPKNRFTYVLPMGGPPAQEVRVYAEHNNIFISGASAAPSIKSMMLGGEDKNKSLTAMHPNPYQSIPTQT